jgi:sec-independent protein translocase protein TatA
MNVMFAGMLGGWEIVLILAVVLILFGAKKLPELAKGLGTGIKEFKKATREVTDEISSAMDTTPSPPANRLPANTTPTPAQPEAQQPTTPQSTPGTKA